MRERVLAGGERYWKLADFSDLGAGAVAHALSRLAADGTLQRVRKGLYYRAKPTVLGPSLPSASGALAQTATVALHPAGLSAANALGFSTQNPARGEYATPAAAPPGLLSGSVVHTRRPASRANLDARDGALLELLRDRGRHSDLPPQETARRLTGMLSEPRDFQRLAAAAMSEPPRVRAMLGALGQQAGAPPAALRPLRDSLNPLSRFDFGPLRALRHAREWQAKRAPGALLGALVADSATYAPSSRLGAQSHGDVRVPQGSGGRPRTSRDAASRSPPDPRR